MSLTNEPISEIVAMKYLQEFPEKYDTKIVRALSLCIHILPRGACVDLSNGEKAMILEDNPEDIPNLLSYSLLIMKSLICVTRTSMTLSRFRIS